MRLRNRLTTPIVLFAIVAACDRAAPAQPQLSPIITWYDCVECTPAQRDAVKALGDSAVSEFRNTLLNGPSRERLDAERERLRKSHRALKDYERRHPENAVTRTEQQYVDAYEAQFVLRNRLRAASALGAIGTTNAFAALRDAQKLNNLPDLLRREIEAALQLAPASPRTVPDR